MANIKKEVIHQNRFVSELADKMLLLNIERNKKACEEIILAVLEKILTEVVDEQKEVYFPGFGAFYPKKNNSARKSEMVSNLCVSRKTRPIKKAANEIAASFDTVTIAFRRSVSKKTRRKIEVDNEKV